ncbi:T9SS type A sorting domain-containing protein [Hymenobacter sp. HSC-4F20]|uniref:M43 family zinc metalloprotease n=1 Tax=Hymenobacter sp. HSC-4F20 TaxID=2864135 RepID=UPI001C73355D|nr:M43 family zinc metalloprotease [Hymenobacter sp. HSC-4F20]MBX0291428.1 T9SS type A sorting domain-containing protein [Hymenobacter sp. HSC-4F20]
MKKTFYSLTLGLACMATVASAQQGQLGNIADRLAAAPQSRQCATMDVLNAQLAADPGLAKRMENIEAQTRQFVSNPAAKRTTAAITIPVVVHVLYNTAAQNVSDAQVQAQIDVLNQDYAKLNPDASLIPAAFAGLAANTNIQFTLAKRTPTGAATTGIIHKSTKVSSWSSNDAVKNSKRGGDDAWDASKYLNIWVCNLGQGLLGYAQFPGGAASTDGVVVLYSSLPGGTAKPYDKGRTATHEVGHWLNLRHIWGDASCGNDLVSDTPTQQTSNYGCPSFPHVTCSNGSNGDMFMNYMDYTDDACMYMFSNGQSARMNALFAAGGARASLATSTGGTAPLLAATSPESLTVYPNPATDQLTIRTGLNTPASNWQAKVYDLRGFEMKQARPTTDGSVDVSSLPNGLYHLVLSNGQSTQHQSFRKE